MPHLTFLWLKSRCDLDTPHFILQYINNVTKFYFADTFLDESEEFSRSGLEAQINFRSNEDRCPCILQLGSWLCIGHAWGKVELVSKLVVLVSMFSVKKLLNYF